MKAIRTTQFMRQEKKLNPNQKKYLDKAVRAVIEKPQIGKRKKGSLSWLYVYKFKMANQLALLGYTIYQERLQIYLIKVGPHENFYRDVHRIT